jgi:hypothetical protein
MTTRINKIWFLTIVCFILFGLNSVFAAPITFTFSGTASGSIGTINFTNDSFIITLSADTANIHNIGSGLYDVDGSSSINLNGIGTANFLILNRVFANNTYNAVGFSRSSTIGGNDFLDLNDSSLNGYNLASNFGPLLVAGPWTGQWTNSPQADTTLGLVIFNTASDVTFTANTASVPLPAPFLLLGSGLLGLAGFKKKIKK